MHQRRSFASADTRRTVGRINDFPFHKSDSVTRTANLVSLRVQYGRLGVDDGTNMLVFAVVAMPIPGRIPCSDELLAEYRHPLIDACLLFVVSAGPVG